MNKKNHGHRLCLPPEGDAGAESDRPDEPEMADRADPQLVSQQDLEEYRLAERAVEKAIDDLAEQRRKLLPKLEGGNRKVAPGWLIVRLRRLPKDKRAWTLAERVLHAVEPQLLFGELDRGTLFGVRVSPTTAPRSVCPKCEAKPPAMNGIKGTMI